LFIEVVLDGNVQPGIIVGVHVLAITDTYDGMGEITITAITKGGHTSGDAAGGGGKFFEPNGAQRGGGRGGVQHVVGIPVVFVGEVRVLRSTGSKPRNVSARSQ